MGSIHACELEAILPMQGNLRQWVLHLTCKEIAVHAERMASAELERGLRSSRATPSASRLVVAALLALASLALHLPLERELRDAGALRAGDILFDADPRSMLKSFSEGQHLGLKHPNLMPFVAPPIALAAAVLAPIADVSEDEMRHQLGRLVSPATAALQAALTFALLCLLEFTTAQAAAATLLMLASFSSFIFGAIPESYALSSLALTIAYLLAVLSRGALTWKWIAAWIAVGVFAMGVTLTNVVQIAIVLLAATWSSRWPLRSGIPAVAIGIAIVALTGVSSYVLDWALVPKDPDRSQGIVARVAKPLDVNVNRYLAPDVWQRLGRFPTAIGNAFAPPRLTLSENVRARYRHLGFTLEATPNLVGGGDPLGLSIVLLLAAGGVCSLLALVSRAVAVASVATLALWWALAFWGWELFLYSQQWMIAAIVLLAGVMKAPRIGPVMTAVVAVLAVAIAVNNLALVRVILATLAL